MPAMFRSLLALALLALAAQGYDFVRYSNPASAALTEADRLYQQAAPLQAAAVSSVPAGQVGVLLQQHLSAGFALPGIGLRMPMAASWSFYPSLAAVLSYASLLCIVCVKGTTIMSAHTACSPVRAAGCRGRRASTRSGRVV